MQFKYKNLKINNYSYKQKNVDTIFKLLKPTGYVTYQQVQHLRILHSAHIVFMCFVFISEQIATFASYNINRLAFITEIKNVYCAVRTGSLNKAVCASVMLMFAIVIIIISNLSNDRSKASSKTILPHSAIQSFPLQLTV